VRPGATMAAPARAAARQVTRPPARNVVTTRHHTDHRATHGNHAAAHHNKQARAHAAARHAAKTRHHKAAHHAHAHNAWKHRHKHHARKHSWWWRHHPHYGWHPWYHPTWSYGVFVYGPHYRTGRVVYVNGQPQPATASAEPVRQVDRTRQFAVGLRGGRYMSGYQQGPSFGDFGMGIAARYRAAEALGFEVSWAHHDQTWSEDTERWSQPLAASAQLFAFPWTKVNPYLSGGLTWTSRCYNDAIYKGPNQTTVEAEDTLFGPHLGLGLELGVGDNASINLEGRGMAYLNKSADDQSAPSALQGTAGFNLYF